MVSMRWLRVGTRGLGCGVGSASARSSGLAIRLCVRSFMFVLMVRVCFLRSRFGPAGGLRCGRGRGRRGTRPEWPARGRFGVLASVLAGLLAGFLVLVPFPAHLSQRFVCLVHLAGGRFETGALPSCQLSRRTSMNFWLASSGSALWRSGCHRRAW